MSEPNNRYWCEETVANILEQLRSDAEERKEGELLDIHISLCHDTEREIKASVHAHIAYAGYLDALADVKKAFGIDKKSENTKIRDE